MSDSENDTNELQSDNESTLKENYTSDEDNDSLNIKPKIKIGSLVEDNSDIDSNIDDIEDIEDIEDIDYIDDIEDIDDIEEDESNDSISSLIKKKTPKTNTKKDKPVIEILVNENTQNEQINMTNQNNDNNYDDDTDTNDDTDDDTDDDDDIFLQKLDRELVSSYIEDMHPESKIHNYDEVKALANVVRNNEGNIIDELHRTIPILTKFEKTRILGIRAKQIDEGGQPLINLSESVIDGYTIALEELSQKAIPFIIKRPLPNGGSEYWRVSDLEII